MKKTYIEFIKEMITTKTGSCKLLFLFFAYPFGALIICGQIFKLFNDSLIGLILGGIFIVFATSFWFYLLAVKWADDIFTTSTC